MACCYAGCTNTRKKNADITFFRFPKEKERRYIWMKKCNNASIQNLSFEELQNRVVCQDHFLPKCFDYSVLTSGRTRKSLFKFALPQPASVIAALIKDDETHGRASPHSPCPLPLLLNEAPLAPMGTGQSRHKDLVSPQRLMNITENSCPLMRPISPLFPEAEAVDYLSIVPEVTMATAESVEEYVDESASEEEEEDEEEDLAVSLPILRLPSDMSSLSPLPSPSPDLIPKLETETKESVFMNTADTAPAFTGTYTVDTTGVLPRMKDLLLPSKYAIKRSLHTSAVSAEEFNANEHNRKYKRILPKRDNKNRAGEARILLKTTIENIPPTANEPTSVHCTNSLDLKNNDRSEEVMLNLSGMSIHKLERTPKDSPAALTTILCLDNNLLQTLPTIDSYKNLTNISLSNNEIDSLIWFGKLTSLRILNLSGNQISDIDGLWKLWHLTHVNLSGNYIQVLRCQTSDPQSKLEFLDVSNNKISSIEDLSMLTSLKELLLHQNQIKSLWQCKWMLPSSLTKITLAENAIFNLGDVAELAGLERLKELSLKKNNCVNVLQLVDSQNNPVGARRSFDYRPYVLTWCLNLAYLDGTQINDQERNKARWLLSQSKLREIPVENHPTLVTYLSEVCPSLSQEQTDEPLLGQLNVTHPVEVKKGFPPPLPPEPQAAPSSKSSAFPPLKLPLPSTKVNSSLESSRKSRKSDVKSTYSFEGTKDNECSPGGPCEHYIELIEEKAKNHKLQRRNEELQIQMENLLQRVECLETTLVENGLSLEDMYVKIEVEDETVDSPVVAS